MEKIADEQQFIDKYIEYPEVQLIADMQTAADLVLKGQTAFIIDRFDKAILIDFREYPTRSIDEPEKEKVLRGSRDGFCETIVFNTALIRRRICDHNLIFKYINTGVKTKTDIAIGYINDKADKKLVEKIVKQIEMASTHSALINTQNLTEILVGKKYINPFPKVKTTERPDVASWNLLEGRIVVIIDNIPSVIILPTFMFDIFQEADDFYFPIITSNYFKIISLIMFFVTIFLVPIWVLLLNYQDTLPSFLEFLKIKTPSNMPILLQIILIEIGIDGLRLASLNTPSSLASALSVVSALILGEFAITTGIFVRETVFFMAITSIATLSQTNFEMGYAMKFSRIIILLLTYTFKLYGFILGTAILFLMILCNKTVSGKSYLYPIIPFNKKDFKRTFFKKSIY